jgi:hypothetical protein
LFRKLGWIADSGIIDEAQWNWKHATKCEVLYVTSPHTPNIKRYKTDTKLYFELKRKTDEVLARLVREYAGVVKAFEDAEKVWTKFPYWEKYLALKTTGTATK